MRIFADFCLSIHLRQVTPAVRRFIRATTFGPQSLKIDLFLPSFTSGGRRYLFHIQTQRPQRPSVSSTLPLLRRQHVNEQAKEILSLIQFRPAVCYR